MPHNRDPLDVEFELRARGYADSAQEARHMVIHEPRVVRALLFSIVVPSRCAEVEVRRILESAITYKPRAADCVAHDGTRIEITLDKHGALGGYRYIGEAPE